VVMGPNLAWGGVRQHIHAIKQYSSLRVELVPPDALLGEFYGDLRQEFLDCLPGDIRVVHSHVLPWFIDWCKRQQESGVRWVHTYHNMYWPEFAEGDLLPWQKGVNHAILNDARRADVRISVSRWQQGYLAKTHGIDTLYLPNGVDVALCDQADAKGFRRQVGDDRFVLYAGRNDPVKNPADFVRLTARLPSQRFVMLGHGLSNEILHDEWGVDVPPNLLVQGGRVSPRCAKRRCCRFRVGGHQQARGSADPGV
jgi:glycosyltransferase involved in cell wall biosynthesis